VIALSVQYYATGWMTGRPIPCRGNEEVFSLSLCPDWLWGTPSLLSSGYQSENGLEHKADHQPLSSAKVKNVWSYTSTLQYMFMAWFLIKQ
jgi:hypothetical protein